MGGDEYLYFFFLPYGRTIIFYTCTSSLDFFNIFLIKLWWSGVSSKMYYYYIPGICLIWWCGGGVFLYLQWCGGVSINVIHHNSQPTKYNKLKQQTNTSQSIFFRYIYYSYIKAIIIKKKSNKIKYNKI